MHRVTSNETALVSKILLINDENVIIPPQQGEKPVSILNDEFFEKQAFPYLLPKDKFGHKTSQDFFF